MLTSIAGVDAARSAGASATFAAKNTGSSPKAVTRSVTETPQDGAECSGRMRRRRRGERDE